MSITMQGFQEDMEELKSNICDNYCKYPEQYQVNEDDLGYEAMWEEVCKNCPLSDL